VKFGLVIAGYDPTSSAGVVLDALTFRMLGIYPLTVVTTLTVQTPNKVQRVVTVDPQYVDETLDTLTRHFKVEAVKIGVLGSAEIANVVANYIENIEAPIVLDPVIRAGDGTLLTDPATLKVIEDRILPRCTVVTPNIHEAEILAELEIRTVDDMKHAAETIAKKYGIEHVLIKGGHLPQGEFIMDVLYDRGNVYVFSSRRINTKDVHGTGCVLSSALAAFLAQGYDVPSAVREARKIVEHNIAFSIDVGYERNLSNVFSYIDLELERCRVIRKLKEALEILEASSQYVVDLIPEVRSNIAYALPATYVRGLEDVAGVPGRITAIDKKIVYFSEPKFGASKHLGRAILTMMKYFPSIRACMNIKYEPELVEIAKKLGFRVAFFDRREEPEEIKHVEGRTMQWGIERAVRELKEPPDIVYDLGDWGKEPQIRVFGKDPVEVVYKVIRLGIEYLKLKERQI